MSELALIKEQTLTNIGDAIREKTSTTDLIMPKDMPAKIRSISSGHTNPLDILDNTYTVTVDQDNMTNQYVEYYTEIASYPDGSIYKSKDHASNVYSHKGTINIKVRVKPNEGYKAGEIKIHSTANLFPDETIDVDDEYNKPLLSDFYVTQVSPASVNMMIDFKEYARRWYENDYTEITQLSATTQNILIDPMREAISSVDYSAPSLERMFYECHKLKYIPRMRFNSTNVENVQYMFSGCNELEKIDISSLDFSKVKNAENMFTNCDKLKSIDLSKFKSDSLESYEGIITYCENLEIIDLRGKFKIKPDIANEYSAMIYNCDKLKYILLNKENSEFISSSKFINWRQNIKRSDDEYLNLLITGTNKELADIRESIESQHLSFRKPTDIDLISNYTINKNDGEITVEPKDTLGWNKLRLEIIPELIKDIDNGKYIKYRISGKYQIGEDTNYLDNYEIPIIIKASKNTTLFFDNNENDYTNGLRYCLDRLSPSYKNASVALRGALESYINKCGLMIIDVDGNSNDKACYIVFSPSSDGTITQLATCRNGVENITNISQISNFNKLTITRIEYKVIEASDIKPTDYKLNFD